MRTPIPQALSLLFLLPFAAFTQDGEKRTDAELTPGSGESIELIPEERDQAKMSDDDCNDYLVSTFDGGNSHNGNMFDLHAKKKLTIDRFTGNLQENGTIAIFYKEGSYQGFAQVDSVWTFLDSAYVLKNPDHAETEIPIDVQLGMVPGDTLGFYITTTGNGKSLNYTGGTSLGSLYSSNSYLEFFEGSGLAYPFAWNTTPRVWNGIVHYCPGIYASSEDGSELSVERALKVHPNPSDGRFRVAFSADGASHLSVRDLQGRLVHERSFTDARAGSEHQLDLSSLPTGLYHLQMRTDEGSRTERIVIH